MAILTELGKLKVMLKLLKLDHICFLLCCLNKLDQDLGILVFISWAHQKQGTI